MSKTRRDDRDEGPQWCILRTSPGRTLPLMASLCAAGIEAWSPKQTQTRRRPRSHITYDVDVPIAPTFVFAREAHLSALLSAQNARPCPHPLFSLFQHGGRIPIVADRSVLGLRQEEARLQAALDLRKAGEERVRQMGERRAKRHVVPVGHHVAIPSGPFAGLTGVVEGGNRKEALVNLGGSLVVKIETWRFAEDIVCTDQAHKGNAALAA